MENGLIVGGLDCQELREQSQRLLLYVERLRSIVLTVFANDP